MISRPASSPSDHAICEVLLDKDHGRCRVVVLLDNALLLDSGIFFISLCYLDDNADHSILWTNICRTGSWRTMWRFSCQRTIIDCIFPDLRDGPEVTVISTIMWFHSDHQRSYRVPVYVEHSSTNSTGSSQTTKKNRR